MLKSVTAQKVRQVLAEAGFSRSVGDANDSTRGYMVVDRDDHISVCHLCSDWDDEVDGEYLRRYLKALEDAGIVVYEEEGRLICTGIEIPGD